MPNKKPSYQDLEKLVSKLQSENKIKKNQDRLNAILKASEDMITIHEPNGKYLYYNGPNCYPITPDDIVGKMPNDFFEEKVSTKLLEAFDKVAKTGVSETLEVLLDWLGEKRWFSEYIYPINDENGNTIELVKVCRDIHQRKLAEEIIAKQNKEKEKRLEELELFKQKIEHTLKVVKENEYSLKEAGRMAKIGYWSFDNYTENLFWSDAIYEIYGFDPELGVPSVEAILSLYTDESRKRVLKSVENLVNNDIPYDIELEFINFKNEKRWIRNIAEPVYNENNENVGRRGVSQDITQKKLDESNLDLQNKKLNELNNALNQAQKLSHVGSWHWDMKNDSAEWSDEMYNIYGVSKDSFYPSNENVSKMMLPEDAHKKEQGIKSLMVDKMFVPFEFRIKRPSGEIRHLYIMALEKNSEDSVFGVTKDITERKRIEEENLRIQDNYMRLFDNASVSIWNEDFSLIFEKIDELRKHDIPDIITYLEEHPEVLFVLLENLKVNNVNKATLKLFKAKSKDQFLNNITETFAEGADKVFIKLVAAIWYNKKTFTSEVNYKTLEGEEFAAIISVPIPQTKIEQKTVPVNIQSIQNIKDIELERKETLNTLKESQEIAKLGSWHFNTETLLTKWSDETYRIWGFNKQEPAPDYYGIVNRIHIDDRELFEKSVEMASEQGMPYDIEFRIKYGEKDYKTLRSICKPIFDNNGKVVSLKGTNQDITEQKLIRDKIDRAEEMYRLLSDNSNDLICLQEADSRFKYISPSIKNLLGYDQSEFLGKKVFSIVHEDDIERLQKSMSQGAFKILDSKPFTFRIRHKEGHFIWFEFLSSPVYKNNEINYFVTIARDITEPMLAKQEIEEYQTALQKLTTEMTLIEENQKKEIASNIHDHLSQSLVISKMKINELKKNPELNIINEDLLFIEKHISEVLENSRKITYELSPPVLYQLGLVEALNWLLEDVEATHKIKCHVVCDDVNIKMSDIKSILVYRSIQELLKNVVKYANASIILLEIEKRNDGVNILIKDDGNGFNTSILNNFNNHSGSGFGLFAVQERIKNIQGKFSITSKINKGTSVNIFIPVS